MVLSLNLNFLPSFMWITFPIHSFFIVYSFDDNSCAKNDCFMNSPKVYIFKRTDLYSVVELSARIHHIYIYIYEGHTISFQTFFEWVLLLIVHT